MVKEFDGKVRVVYKNFVVHPQTVMLAHQAGCAANKQQKFSEFSNLYWEKGFRASRKNRDPSAKGEENLLKMATELKLDTAKFKADMNSDECKKAVQADSAELSKFRVGGTPSFFMNGKPVRFAGVEQFRDQINKELKAVEASGVPAAEYYDKVVMAGLKTFRSKADAEKGAQTNK